MRTPRCIIPFLYTHYRIVVTVILEKWCIVVPVHGGLTHMRVKSCDEAHRGKCDVRGCGASIPLPKTQEPKERVADPVKTF